MWAVQLKTQSHKMSGFVPVYNSEGVVLTEWEGETL